jgi:hypothetical protein
MLFEKLNNFIFELRVLRYEDISLNLEPNFDSLLNHFGLSFHPDILNFLDTHTIQSFGPDSSTFRDSKITPFKWIEYFKEGKAEELQDIQDICQEAMEVWGYAPINLEQLETKHYSTLLKFPFQKDKVTEEK